MIIYHNQVSFIPGMQGVFNILKLINLIYHINKWEDKNCMIISIDAEKTWQNSTPIYDKSSPESRHRRNLPQHDKGYIRQTYSKYYSQEWKTESISSKIRKKTRVPTLIKIIQQSFGSPSYSNQRRKIKRNPYRKRSKSHCLQIIIYIKNSKDATRKLLELFSEYSKVTEYKINTQKSLAFLHTNNEKIRNRN